MVALEGKDLEDAAHEYFLRSEQIPTCVRLAVARGAVEPGGAAVRWRAGGILLQFLPQSPERARRPRSAIPAMCRKAWCCDQLPEDEAWVEGASLVETVEDIELMDPEPVGRAASLSAVP